MFPIAVALVATSLLYMLLVVVRSRRPMPVPDRGDTDLSYVVVVPCLDEEMVIAEHARLPVRAAGDRLRIIVVDDDSSDRTSEIVQAIRARASSSSSGAGRGPRSARATP